MAESFTSRSHADVLTNGEKKIRTAGSMEGANRRKMKRAALEQSYVGKVQRMGPVYQYEVIVKDKGISGLPGVPRRGKQRESGHR